MRLIIKHAYVAEAINLRDWFPIDENDIAEFICLEIGGKGNNKSDTFIIRICTPMALVRGLEDNHIINGRAMVIMAEYNFSHLWEWLEQNVSSCEGDTWAKHVENLRQFFDWVYDNLRHNSFLGEYVTGF